MGRLYLAGLTRRGRGRGHADSVIIYNRCELFIHDGGCVQHAAFVTRKMLLYRSWYRQEGGRAKPGRFKCVLNMRSSIVDLKRQNSLKVGTDKPDRAKS